MTTDGWAHHLALFETISMAEGNAPRTIELRRKALDRFSAAMTAMGAAGPEEVTYPRLISYFAAENRRRHGAGPAVHYDDVARFWSLWSREHKAYNPMRDLRRPAEPVARTDVLTPAQMARIWDATDGPGFLRRRDRAIVALLAGTGIRRQELASLEVRDVNTRIRSLDIRHGKGDRPRTLEMPPETALAVARYLVARRGRRTAAESEALFLGRSGEQLSYSAIGQLIRSIGRRAGMPHLRSHLFRHRFAHESLAGGKQESAVVIAMGWTSGSQLKRYGASLAAQRSREAFRAHPVSVTGRSR